MVGVAIINAYIRHKNKWRGRLKHEHTFRGTLFAKIVKISHREEPAYICHCFRSRLPQRTSTSHSPPSPPALGILFKAILTRRFPDAYPVSVVKSDPRSNMVCWLSPAEEENSVGKDIGEHSPYAEFAPRNGSRSNDEGGGKDDNAEELKESRLISVCAPAHIDSDEDEDER